jgi:hypothetical protein
MDRCAFCKKKSHILIDCKCGMKVCSSKCIVNHENHNCTFDHKLNARYKLAINNPKIEAKKVEQI